MKRVMIVVTLLAMFVGCDGWFLMSPDEDDVRDKTEEIGGLPWAVQQSLRAWAANRFTAGYISGLDRGSSRRVVSVDCERQGRRDINSSTIVECLRNETDMTYMGCVIKALTDLRYYDGSHDECKIDETSWAVGYHPDSLPDECDPEQVKLDRVVVELIKLKADELKANPALMAMLGLAVGAGGGIIVIQQLGGFTLVLCAQSKAIVCPDDPSEPGVPQYGTPPAGDR